MISIIILNITNVQIRIVEGDKVNPALFAM